MKGMKKKDVRAKGKKWAGLALLAAVLFFVGCGAGEDAGQQKSEAGGQNGQEETWNPEEEPLYARYQSFVLGDKKGTMEKLIKMDCLAAEQGVFVTGIRNNQGVAEAVFYLLAQEAEPRLVAVYPGERTSAWCRTREGIAFLGAKAQRTEEESRVEYVLHLLKWDQDAAALTETESVSLTECFAEAGTETGFSGKMAVGEEQLFFTDMIGNHILVVDRSNLSAGWLEMREYVNGIWCTDTGEIFALTMEGKLYSWSAEGGAFKSRTEESLGQFGAGCSFLGKDWIYAGSGQSLYAYGLDGKKSKKLMDYDIGLLFDSSLWMDEAAGRGILASWDSESGTLQCYYLTDQPVEAAAEEADNKETENEETENKEKEIVYLEQFFVQDDLKRAVAAFNEQSSQYRVEITEGRSTTDFETFGTQLQIRILAGEGPDLVDMSVNAYFKDYVKVGAFEDLAPWIKRDLNPEDYIEPMLYAYEMEDGGVYALGSSFGLSVIVADKRLAGSGEDWNLQKMFQMMDEARIDTFCIGYNRENLLNEFCLPGLDDQIYDMEKIREYILFAEKYGDDEQNGQSRPDKVVPGQDAAVEREWIRSPLDVPDILRYYGENTVILGYPMEEGDEVVCEFGMGALSINALSKNKEGAWAFLKFLLEEEYQDTIEDTFPVLRGAFEEMLEEYQSPRTYDVYLEDTGEIDTISIGYMLGRCSRENNLNNPVLIDCMSGEEAELLRKLIEKSKPIVLRLNFQASQIILEEVQSYYQGDKSAEDVLKVMEGRLKILQAE